MNDQIFNVNDSNWQAVLVDDKWIKALEAGKVLHFSQLQFPLPLIEQGLLTPEIRNPKSRNISLNNNRQLKGALGDDETKIALSAMLGRFREQALSLVNSYFPHYKEHLILGPTSFRPAKIETRAQSWRADDRLLHVDAFPSRPNNGERILRVFININPLNIARVWRVGESFESVVERFLPHTTQYSAWRARALNVFGVTKSLRSEYDHLMLQLHDGMKQDLAYQRNCSQITIPFPAGSVWACFSDQVTHAAMSGQYMMEQTFHLSASKQYNAESSLLAILRHYTGRNLT